MTTSTEQVSTSESISKDTLPVGALLALTMTGFLCIITETLPAGLLHDIGGDLSVSPAKAGQMVTAYAFGSLSAAIPLSVATQLWSRRSVLLTTIIGFLIFNSVTAISTSFALTLVARFMVGAAAGLGWSLIGGYARRMVKPQLQGRALALAMAGTPLALSLGVPLGTWGGSLFGWRATFAAISGMSIMLLVWVMMRVPNYPGQSDGKRVSLGDALGKTGVKPILGVIVTWMLAHNILYTYISPFLVSAGLSEQVDRVLLVFGCAALAGIWVVSRNVDDHLRISVLTSLAGFATVAAVFAVVPNVPIMVYLGVVGWGLSFGGAATLLQTALAKAAGPAADVAQSISVVAWNSAIGGGGLVGGLVLHQLGAGTFPWILLVLITTAFCIAYWCSSHAFPKSDERQRS